MTEPEPPAAETPDERIGGEAESAGAGLVLVDFVGTGVLAVAAVAGIAAPDSVGVLAAITFSVLFAIGVVLFLWGYAMGVVRSRDEQVTMGGLFFLSGTAPKVVRFRLRMAFAAQVVLAFAAASLRPYTSVAFAVLAPVLGLGVMAAWAARHGTFFAKDDDRGRR